MNYPVDILLDISFINDQKIMFQFLVRHLTNGWINNLSVVDYIHYLYNELIFSLKKYSIELFKFCFDVRQSSR